MERFQDKLGPPDVHLSGLQLWVHGYQYPHIADSWDGNWLNTTAHCGASGASVWASGAILDTVSLEQFCNGLEMIYERLEGTAELSTDEPYLSAHVGGGAHGRLTMTVRITPDELTQEHEFRFDLDQTYLPPVITALRETLARFPIRGDRRHAPPGPK